MYNVYQFSTADEPIRHLKKIINQNSELEIDFLGEFYPFKMLYPISMWNQYSGSQ